MFWDKNLLEILWPTDPNLGKNIVKRGLNTCSSNAAGLKSLLSPGNITSGTMKEPHMPLNKTLHTYTEMYNLAHYARNVLDWYNK